MRQHMLRGSMLAAAVAVCLTMACAQPDSVITGKVKAEMAVDPTVKAVQIEVSTSNGVVTLTGNLDSQAEKDRALEIARSAGGVTNVVDMLAVRTSPESGDAPDPGRSVGEHVDDALITAAVKTRLLEDPMVKGSKIDVDTRAGVVFLTGSVRSREESERAVEVARATDHVKDVKPNLVVTKG
jgi:hyperosmotically inducible periplasmic protein